MYRLQLFPRTRNTASLARHPLVGLHRQMSRLFGDSLLPSAEPCGDDSCGTDTPLAPSLDVSEADGVLRITTELPGVSEKDVSVTVEDDVLVISGEKTGEVEEEGRNWHRRERSYGKFRRALRLTDDLDTDAVAATYSNGVLTVTVPRKEEADAGRRTIEVKSKSEN